MIGKRHMNWIDILKVVRTAANSNWALDLHDCPGPKNKNYIKIPIEKNFLL